MAQRRTDGMGTYLRLYRYPKTYAGGKGTNDGKCPTHLLVLGLEGRRFGLIMHAFAIYSRKNGGGAFAGGGIEAGIKLYGGVSGNADEAVLALINGTLGYNPDVRCDHHDHEHGEGGHTCGSHGCGNNCH